MSKKELFKKLLSEYDQTSNKLANLLDSIKKETLISNSEIKEVSESFEVLSDTQNELYKILKIEEGSIHNMKELENIVKKNSIDESKEYLLKRLSKFSSIEYKDLLTQIINQIASLDDSTESIEIAYAYRQLLDLYDKEKNKVNVLTKTFSIVNFVNPDFLLKLCYGLITENNLNDNQDANLNDNQDVKQIEEINQPIVKEEIKVEVDKKESKAIEDLPDADMLDILSEFEDQNYKDFYSIVKKYDFNLTSKIMKENIELAKKNVKFNKNTFLSSKNDNLDKYLSAVLLNLYTNGYLVFDEIKEKNHKMVVAFLYNNGYLAKVNHETFGPIYFLTEAGSKIFEIYQVQKLIEKYQRVKITYGKADLEILHSLIDKESMDEAIHVLKYSIHELEEKNIEYRTMPSARKSLIMASTKEGFNYIFFVGKGAFSFISLVKVIVDNRDAFNGNLVFITKDLEYSQLIMNIVHEYLNDKNDHIKDYYCTTYDQYDCYQNEKRTINFNQLMALETIDYSKDLVIEEKIEIQEELKKEQKDEVGTFDLETKNEEVSPIIQEEKNSLDVKNLLAKVEKVLSKEERDEYESSIQSRETSSEIALAMEYNNYYSDDVNQHLVNTLILENRLDVCLLLLSELQKRNDTFRSEYILLQCATGNSGDNYDGSLLNNYFTDIAGNMDDLQMACFVSTLIRILFRPAMVHDYKITGWYETFKNMNSDLQYFSIIKKIAKTLKDVLVTDIAGFSKASLAKFKEKKDYKYQLIKLRERAKGMMQKKQFTFTDHGLFSKCIGDKSDIYKALSYCVVEKAQDPEANLSFIRNVVNKYKDNNDFMDSRITTDLRQANSTLRSNKTTLKPLNEKEIIREYKARLEILLDYLELVEARDEFSETLSKARNEVIDLIHEYQNKLDHNMENAIINNTFDYILMELDGKNELHSEIKEYLITPYILLDDFLKVSTIECPYFSLYDRIISHIGEYEVTFHYEETLLEAVHTHLTNENVGILESVRSYLENNSLRIDFDFDLCEDYKTSIQKQQKELIDDFINKIDLDSMYGRIDELVVEELYGEIEEIRIYFNGQYNLGVLKSCIAKMRKAIHKHINKRKNEYVERFNELMLNKSESDYPIMKDIYEAIKEENFTVAEEYLQLLQNDCKEINNGKSNFENYFLDYLSNYQEILDTLSICHGRSLRSKTTQLGEKLKALASNALSIHENHKNIDETFSILEYWPRSAEGLDGFINNQENVKNLLESLQFVVEEISELQYVKTTPYYNVRMQKGSKQLVEYFHPISVFGTAMQDNVPVVYIDHIQNAQDLNNFMTKEFNYEGYSICILDCAFPLSERKKLAYYFKTSGTLLHRYLVLDRTLLAYLAMVSVSERQKAFIKCTMPFTYIQPFAENGSGRIPDEMFYGRAHELNSIIDIMNGTNLVYGGRQLGKTALLQRVQNLMMKPEEKSYTIYLEITRCKSSEEVLDLIIKEILSLQAKINKSILISKQKAKTIHDFASFSQAIKNAYRRGDFNRLYLLIDEADEFIASQEKTQYEAINELILLKDDTDLKGHFKFILAGLHNVAKFINNKENDSIRKLGNPLCIKPLSTLDAKRFILEPLACIGYNFSNPDQQISMILSKLNYYPGLLHLFCAKIINSTNHYYSDYFTEEKNPPYTIDDKILGKLLTNNEINKEVNNKLTMTLDLNGSLYSKIACAISYRYEYDDQKNGLSIEEIREFFEEDYEIKKIQTLVDEMIELGILTKNKENKYFYRKYNFHKSLLLEKSETELMEVAFKNYEK